MTIIGVASINRLYAFKMIYADVLSLTI